MKKLVFLTLFAASCASEPPVRNTVQADVIAKSDLDGVFYYRQTVVGVPYTTGFTFIGEQGDNELEKIRWDIQENVITARRSWEWVRGTEKGEPSHGTGPYLGAPVAAYKVKSHFDIVRDYNSSTGEEYNKIVENTERKWYERKFMHVDWSENLISNFQFLADFDHGGISAIKQDPAPYFVSDPKDPDHMRIERKNAETPADYLEITQKIIASPSSIDFEDEKNVPLCFLEYATEDCASQEIKIRSSFLRAEKRDYDPLVYDDHMMERFGYFTTDRAGYNRQYGETDTGKFRMINRFNLWQRNLSDKACKIDDDCKPLDPGVRCIAALPESMGGAVDAKDGTSIGLCSLPWTERNKVVLPGDNATPQDIGPRKVVYYLNDSFPNEPELHAAAQRMADEYDDTFRGIYKTLVGKDAPTKMFVLCHHNPVEKGDAPECGPEGTNPRIGDIRYNMVYWVDEPNNGGLLGYGPSSHDPETGETISATAFVYGAGHDLLAARARDIVRLVNGETSPDEFISGVDVQQWVTDHQKGPKSRTLTQADVDSMADHMDTRWTEALPKTPSIHKAPARKMAEMARARGKALAQSQILGADPGLAAARLSRLKGTPIERQLANGEILLARGLDPRQPSAQVDLSRVAPLSLVNPERARFVSRQRRKLGARGLDLAESFDDAVLGLAIQQIGKDPQEVWKKIRVEVFRSTAEHEVGHTIGLRHNFAGSYDAMNYPKTYWDLRNADGPPKPRYLDPETAAEKKGVTSSNGLQSGISEFQYSSIMDYGARFNTDLQGIGRYDRAALKFGYGQIVEVFNTTKDGYLLGALQSTITFGLPQPLAVDCKGQDYISIHYTKLPQIVDLEDRTDVPWSQISNSTPISTCAYPDAVDHDENFRLVVPYRFCSDEFEGAAIDCAAFDRGADVYEVSADAISTYKNYYLFNNFKRDRLGFNPDGYLDRIYTRYLDPLRQQMQFYVLFKGDYANDIPDSGQPNNFWRSPDGWGPFTVAVTDGFNLFGEILTSPEPGNYYKITLADGKKAYQADPYSSGGEDFILNIPDARYFATEWDYNAGYYWYERVSHVGNFLDKVAAIGQLTDPETWFLGVDTATDVRQYSINYYRLFPRQMTDLWSAAMTDHWEDYAPLWDGQNIVHRNISDPIRPPSIKELPVDPMIGFSVQLYASSLGMALIPATFDQTFVDSGRIFLQGNGEQIDSSKPKVTFTDPFSGRIYVALSYKDANAVETGLGARMLARAADLAALVKPNNPASEAPLRNFVQVLEVQRTLSVAYADALN